MSQPNDSTNPYVGPRTFTREQAHLFFGREREAEELFSRVVAQRLVLFYAQSGAGKSSLINTQLIPRLEDAGFVVLPVGRVGGDLHLGVDDTVANIYLFNLMSSLDQSQGDPARFAHLTLPHFLERLTTADGATWYYEDKETGRQGDREIRGQGDKEMDSHSAFRTPNAALPNYVLIIDQFEEIITTHATRWPEREEFFRQLEAAMLADPTLWVVLTLREDFVAALDPYAPLLSDKLRARYYMQRMGLDAARSAIRQPAAQRHRHFLPEAVALLVNSLSQVRVAGKATTESGQYVEPVQLQVVCYQLWERLKHRLSPVITKEDVEKAGDVDSALASFYAATLAAALREHPLAGGERRLRRWFEEQLITEAGTRGTVYQGASETAGLPNALVEPLEKSWLLRGESRAGGRWIELTHDRFVEPIRSANRAWEAQQNNPLTTPTRLWLAHSRDPLRLLRDQPLADAQTFTQANPHVLTTDEQALLAASVRLQAEEQEQARQATRQRRNLITTGVLLLALFAGLAWWGWRNAALAQQQVTRLEGERLLKEVRTRKERLVTAAIGTAPAPTTFVSPLASPLTVTVGAGTAIAASEAFTAPQAIVNEVVIIRQLLTQTVAADPSLQVDMITEEADVLRQAATRLVQEGERLAAQGKPKEAGALFQLAFDLHPPPDTLLYVWIAPGEFRMGSSDADSFADDNEKPQHPVQVDGFWIMRTEVTNAQYARCVAAQACTPPANQRWNKAQFARHPVTDVDWAQASAYAQWVGGRLPSEAQWEKSCRSTDARLYPWGDDAPSAERLNYLSSGLDTWTDVGTYPAGANGLYDMAGNVQEWTADWYDATYYATSPPANPTGPEKGDTHLLRSGAWYVNGQGVRCAFRDHSPPYYSNDDAGFRVVSPGS